MCFPDLLQRLVPEELHVLSVCHSIALWALWSVRPHENAPQLLWPCFLQRLEARIYIDYQLDTSSNHSVFINRWCSGSIVKITKDGIYFAESNLMKDH